MNIKCEVIRDLLPLYVDGVVSEETRSLIEEHLKDCADCREYLRLLQEDLPQEEELDFADEAASLKKIKSKMLRNRIMTIVITVTFVVLAGVVIHSAHLTEYTGSIDENLTYELPDGYELMESSTDSNVEEKDYIRKTDSSKETICICYEGMYDNEGFYSAVDKVYQIDESTKVNVSILDFDDGYSELQYLIIHENEFYLITYTCIDLDKGEYFYSSCSKAQQEEMLEFIKTIDYHRPDGSDLNIFQRLYHNLHVYGLIVLVLAILVFIGVPVAFAIISYLGDDSKSNDNSISSRELHDSMNRERKAKGEASLPAINNLGGASTNNLARRDHSWSSLPDFFIKLFRRK